jgi:hypothetical protein
MPPSSARAVSPWPSEATIISQHDHIGLSEGIPDSEDEAAVQFQMPIQREVMSHPSKD